MHAAGAMQLRDGCSLSFFFISSVIFADAAGDGQGRGGSMPCLAESTVLKTEL